MPRFTATFKASGLPSRNQNGPLSVFFFLDDDATDAMALTAAQTIAGLMNGELVSITRQVYASANLNGPYASAQANGGSSAARVTFRDTAGNVDNLNLPLLRDGVSKQAIEAALEAANPPLLNRLGNPLGQVVAIRANQVVDA